MIDQQKYKQTKAIVLLKSNQNANNLPQIIKKYSIKFTLQKTLEKQRTQPLRKSHSILDHMMRTQYEYFSKSSRVFHKISLHFVQQFLNKIKSEIENNEIYNNLIESKYIIDILSEHQRCYINHQQFSQLIELVLDYMAISKNYINKDQSKLPTNLKLTNLSSSIASRWLKLKNQIYFNNKDSLKMLQYICPNQTSRKQYGHSFLDLHFDFSLEEIRKVAAAVKHLCKQDIRTFCYLTNYLYICCQKLQENKVSLSEIDSTLRDRLKMLDQENLPAPPFQGEDSLVEVHKDFKIKSHQYPSKYINLSELDEVHKMKALQNYIQRRINQAIESLYVFNDLVKNTCLNHGYHFVSSLKLKDKTQKMALNRVIEKIFVQHSKKSQSSYVKQSKQYQTIQQLTSGQYQQYERYIRQLIKNINEPIEFKVSDLLRSKCMFANAYKLNSCLSQLKHQIKERGYKIIEIKNRLKKKTSDFLIKLLIQQTVAQVQLAIDFNVAENQFNHKIYELRRSQLFTPLAMLKQLNQKMSNNYFREMNAIINSNLKAKQSHQYFDQISFEQIQQHFEKLIEMLPVNIRFDKLHRNQVDINLMGKQVRRFAQIKDQQVVQNPILNKLQKLKRNGEYLFGIRAYSLAEKQLERYCEVFKEQNTKLFEKINNNFAKLHATWHNLKKCQQSLGKIVLQSHQKYLAKNYSQAFSLISKINTEIGNYDKSIQKSKICKSILSKISIDDNDWHLREIQKNIAWNLFKKGNYSQAIEVYQNYLHMIQSIKGNNRLQHALILNHMGLVFQKSGNFNQCLDYFQRSLQIQQQIKGKHSIQYSVTLSNIGISYLNQGQYSKSIQIFHRCLEIEQKEIGKDSLNCAETLNNLGNVYNLIGKSQEALSYYKRCLLIEQKIKGKQSIDFAMILNNIGLIYFNEYNYQQALPYFRKCLKVKQQIIGKSNIDLIPTLTNMGVLLSNTGSYSQALAIYNRCLTIQQKTNNKDSISYSNTLNNIAIVQKQLGNYLRAIQLLQKGLKIIENIEGSDNIDYAFLMGSMGEVYYDMKNYEYSLVHYQISLQTMQKILGRQCIDYANVLNCIGEIHCKLNNLPQAQRYSEQSLIIKESIKGKDKIESVSCLNNLAQICLKMGNVQECQQKYNLAINICKQNKCKFIDYVKACLGLALLYEQTNQLDMGISIKQSVLQILKKLKPKIYEEYIEKENKTHKTTFN